MLCRMQICSMHHGCHILRIRQRLHGLVPYVNGMLHRPLPVRVLVDDGGQDLRQMVAVRVPDERPEYLRPPVGLDAVLDVVSVECQVCLGFDDAQQQVVARQLGNYRFSEEDVVQDADGVLDVGTRRGVAVVLVVVGGFT